MELTAYNNNAKEINNTSLDNDNDDIDDIDDNDDNDDIKFTDKHSSRIEIMFAALIVFLVGSGLIIKYV